MASDNHKEATANVEPVKDDSKQVSAGSSSETLPVAAPKRVKDISEGAFDTTEDPRFYKPIDDYEGIHRWDPDFEWGEQEEKKLIRKGTSIVSAFLAYGFLHVRRPDGTGGWRYLFAFEGLITGVIAIIAAFWMPASPTQTKGGFRGKDGWFNEREEKIMVNRVLRDDPSKGGMHNRQAVTPKMLWEALCDYDMWPIYLLGLTWMIPNSPATSYITLQLKSLGFDTFESNLLTIPAYVIFIINLLVWTWISERFYQRLILGVGSMIWCLVLLIALETLPDNASPWARWIINVLLIGAPYVHAIIVAMTSRNAGTVRTRTVATAVYNMMVQTSSIISNNVNSSINIRAKRARSSWTWIRGASYDFKSLCDTTSFRIRELGGQLLIDLIEEYKIHAAHIGVSLVVSSIGAPCTHHIQAALLPNHILTPIFPNPHLMQLSSRYIDPGPNPKRLLLNLPIIESSIVLGIRNCKGTLSNKMRRQAGVSMRRVICIAIKRTEISPSRGIPKSNA
ncbi:unnamed protein product [Aspergillus oryzae]|nr:unnamed protein product [Aspergillus oryzae]GMF95784.1 unnamed protein product [Aspergillus oryzae]